MNVAPIIEALSGAEVPLVILIAGAIAIVLIALARVVTSLQPWLVERERTRRALGQPRRPKRRRRR